jgi:hypothetical protein
VSADLETTALGMMLGRLERLNESFVADVPDRSRPGLPLFQPGSPPSTRRMAPVVKLEASEAK